MTISDRGSRPTRYDEPADRVRLFPPMSTTSTGWAAGRRQVNGSFMWSSPRAATTVSHPADATATIAASHHRPVTFWLPGSWTTGPAVPVPPAADTPVSRSPCQPLPTCGRLRQPRPAGGSACQ